MIEGLRFPRHRAAASLKRQPDAAHADHFVGFPRHRAAASLKRARQVIDLPRIKRVFRGIGPRPH